ncbi:MAG: cation diffusion facilitator family transporter [Lachnospiraceae bacterium]
MISLLERIFIKDREEVKNPMVRKKYGILCGAVGIFLNILLFMGKFVAGYITNSISITADAINNLSDAGSSAVTLIGFQMAGAKPDMNHPFGHGRIEYVSGLIVSGAIIIMAFELMKTSIDKMIHPKPVEFSKLAVAILLIAIAVKMYMAYYNYRIGKKIESAAMRATAIDSLSDTCATTAVLAASIIGFMTGAQVDGICGVLVGIFIFYAGISAAKDTLNPLLGQPPEEEFVQQIERQVLSHEEIRGLHDLVVHDYGPGRRMISLHAEVPAEGNILQLHDVVDNVESELRRELNCDAVIHMDPVVTEDKHVLELKTEVLQLMKEIDAVISVHDFRVVIGPTHTNMIFDIVVPYGYKISDEELVNMIQKRTWEKLGEQYFVVVQVDKGFHK